MRKPKHSDRKHAQWSASATERNWLCPGNLALIGDVVQGPESRAAAWGTACHEVSEKLLKHQPIDIGDEIETDRFIFYVDEEMMQCAWVYVDWVRESVKQGYSIIAIEQKFDLKSLGLPMDIGGTADVVLHNSAIKRLRIGDLKTGKGKWVDALRNPQERLYALGVLVGANLNSMPVVTVETVIIQPRYGDEPVRSDVFHITDLMDWTIDLVPKVNMAAEAIKTYALARENTVLLDEWVETYLQPGEVQCTFCPVAGGCPALRKRALEIAGQDGSGVFQPNVFAQNSVEAVEADLDMMEHLENWIRERRALAHEMAAQGIQFDHHTLVEKIGHRKFNGGGEAAIVKAIRERIPIADEQLFDTKLKSPAGLEKAIGKKAVEAHLADLIIRPVTGTDLIRSTHTGRTAAPTVADFIINQE